MVVPSEDPLFELVGFPDDEWPSFLDFALNNDPVVGDGELVPDDSPVAADGLDFGEDAPAGVGDEDGDEDSGPAADDLDVGVESPETTDWGVREDGGEGKEVSSEDGADGPFAIESPETWDSAEGSF